MKNLKNNIFLVGVMTWIITGGYLSIAFLVPNFFEPTISLKIFGVSFFVWLLPTIYDNINNITKLGNNPITPNGKKVGCSTCKQKNG
jgi:hypothetical protein